MIDVVILTNRIYYNKTNQIRQAFERIKFVKINLLLYISVLTGFYYRRVIINYFFYSWGTLCYSLSSDL